MSGHSKWSTIKRKKEKTDGARAKVFTICQTLSITDKDMADFRQFEESLEEEDEDGIS